MNTARWQREVTVMAVPTKVRDLGWSAAGVLSAYSALKAMEWARPTVIADDFSAPENHIGIGDLPRAYGVSATAALVSPLLAFTRMPDRCGPVGLVATATGLALRVWAMRTLRGHYAHALRVVDDQPVIRTGPYRAVRHPGYLSAVVVCLGGAISTRNAVPVAVTLFVVGRAYRRRMDAEDALLIRELPGYADYASATGRMIPRIPERPLVHGRGGVTVQ